MSTPFANICSNKPDCPDNGASWEAQRRDAFRIQAKSCFVSPHLLVVCGITLSWRKG